MTTSVGDTEERTADDQTLAQQASLGDRAAFAQIYARHGEAMFRYALQMLDGRAVDAEDAVQNAWIRAWQHLGDFRGDSQLRTWLFTIAGREVLNARRKRRPVPVEDGALEVQAEPRHLGPDSQTSQTHLRNALEQALTELAWRQRASWLLFEVEGLSYEEIAQILDTSPTVVRGQLHRARRTLAVRMAPWR